jgi:hypothetical protein
MIRKIAAFLAVAAAENSVLNIALTIVPRKITKALPQKGANVIMTLVTRAMVLIAPKVLTIQEVPRRVIMAKVATMVMGKVLVVVKVVAIMERAMAIMARKSLPLPATRKVAMIPKTTPWNVLKLATILILRCLIYQILKMKRKQRKFTLPLMKRVFLLNVFLLCTLHLVKI